MQDFHYIFFPIGPQFIKTLISTFKWVPKDTNVIVLTNTPEFFDNLDINFNLTVLDIDQLSDKESQLNEPLIKEYDNDKFISKLLEKSKEGNIFPYGKHRFVIPWLLERNITKFALLDSDCVLNYHNQHTSVLNHINTEYAGKNLLISLPMNFTADINNIWDNFSEAFTKYGISEDEVKSLGNDLKMNDGWLRGFDFKDKNLLEMYFNIWNDILKISYSNKHDLLKWNSWTVADEWIHGILSLLLKKKFDIITEDITFGGHRLVHHFYHPENDYFNLHHGSLYQDMYKMVQTTSRQEFYKKNKDNIIKFYKYQNGVDPVNVKKLIYDWPYE
jgi:hypothetical protein|tara:strand:+ start:427 stop:1419 length:993 start_codon:yes stop_codon:yes gene_type:complete